MVDLLEEEEVDYMLIGGLALPLYGRIRATLDMDIAVSVPTENDFNRLVTKAGDRSYAVALASFRNPMCLFHDLATGYEIEIWTRPDGITWDQDTLNRRRKATIGSTEVWIVSPEDFIVSKLARPDRGVSDEQDVKSVFERSEAQLDKEYLKKRAEAAGVWALLQMISRT